MALSAFAGCGAVGAFICVGVMEAVSVFAVCLLCFAASLYVFAGGDGFQMSGVDASGVAAQVVDGEFVRYGSYEQLVGESVGVLFFTVRSCGASVP